MSPKSAAQAATTGAAAAGRAPTCRSLLLVDDSPGDIELAIEVLGLAPSPLFEVRCAATLQQALDHLAAHTVDAVILDLNLPDSSGADTVRRVRQSAPGTPIVVLTGVVDQTLREHIVAEGAEDVYAKDEAHTRLFWRSIAQIVDHRRERRRELQQLLDTTPDAILVLDAGGQVRYANQSALELLEQDAPALLGRTLNWQFDETGPTEVRIDRRTGTCVCEMRVAPLVWHDQPAWLASLRDITAWRHAQVLQARSTELEFENHRIREASRLKTAFLANMSHELRTPLNAIIGFSQLMLDGGIEAGSPQSQVFLGHILGSGRHLLQLINDVLDLTKIEAGKLRLDPEPLQLGPLIEEVCANLEALARQRRLRLQISHDGRIGELFLDPSRLRQVLYNYLSNALKFAPPDSTVRVQTERLDGGRFRLAVVDLGPGIAAVDIPKLFTEFHQLETDQHSRHAGSGLGLALTRHLVQAQGGEAGVNSELGRGSEFWVMLPCRCTARGHEEPSPWKPH